MEWPGGIGHSRQSLLLSTKGRPERRPSDPALRQRRVSGVRLPFTITEAGTLPTVREVVVGVPRDAAWVTVTGAAVGATIEGAGNSWHALLSAKKPKYLLFNRKHFQ